MAAPKLMAIGDSMYQGVRSLSFTPALGRVSVPALVANALGIQDFRTPDWKQPVLFDLEELLRSGGLGHLAITLGPTVVSNLTAWLSQAGWSSTECFDNLAIGCADIAQLWTDSDTLWEEYQGDASQGAKALAGKVLDTGTIALKDVGPLWYRLNVCATLNPTRGKAWAGKSQVQQVRERGPEILLVNIGSNEGLFRAAFAGDFTPKNIAAVMEIPRKMDALGQILETLPASVERIVVNSLVRPRTAPNLWPAIDPNDYPGDDYYPSYSPRLGNRMDIPGATLKSFDDTIASVNRLSQAALRQHLGDRLVWVDLYEATSAHDGKHYPDRGVKVQRNGRTVTLTNIPLEVRPWGGFNRGGLGGLDNMHPSVPGYALIANAVLEAMGETARIDLQAAYGQDTLLTNLPASLSLNAFELSLLGSFGVLG